MFNFLINYPHYIFLFLNSVLLLLTLYKSAFSSSFLNKVSWATLLVTAILLQFFYAATLTTLQYMVWSGVPLTSIFTTLPVPPSVPLGMLYFAHSILFKTHGYFIFYAWMHFFFKVFILYFFILFSAILMLLWKKYEPSHFKIGDISATLIALSVVGWPKLILLVPLAFTVLIFLALYSKFCKIIPISLPVVFLAGALILLLIGDLLLVRLGISSLLTT